MKHIIKVEVLQNLPETRPLLAMDATGKLQAEGKTPGPVPPVGPANDEIWYTTTDGNPIKLGSGGSGSGSGSGSGGEWPEHTNTYEGGKGVITFNEDLTEIPNNGFYNQEMLESIMLPNSVTRIGDNAFYGCARLRKVNITDIAAWCNIAFGTSYSNPLCYANYLYVNNVEVTNLVIPNSVTSIGDYAFDGCSGLTSVAIPDSVTRIGGHAFEDCTRLASATIGNNVTSIGNYAFYGCTRLASVTIPNSVTSIEQYAFYGCAGLTSVTIPNSVTSIENNAFMSCTGLTSIIISNSVTNIKAWTFSNCISLTSVTIPDSVTSIENNAFRECGSLTSISYTGTISQWNAITKGDLWNLQIPARKVHCTDGDVNL